MLAQKLVCLFKSIILSYLFSSLNKKLTRIELWDLNAHFNQVINWK